MKPCLLVAAVHVVCLVAAPVCNAVESSTGEVEAWLRSLALEEWAVVFQKERFSTLDDVQLITEDDLKAMKLPRGHVRRILHALEARLSAANSTAVTPLAVAKEKLAKMYVISLDGVDGADPHNAGRFAGFKEDWAEQCGGEVPLDLVRCPGHLDKRRGFGLTVSLVGCIEKAIADDVSVAYFFEDDARLFESKFCNATHRANFWKHAPADTFLAILGGHNFVARNQTDSWSLPTSALPTGVEPLGQSFGTYGFAVPRSNLQALHDGYQKDIATGGYTVNGKLQQAISPDICFYKLAQQHQQTIYAASPLVVKHVAGWSNTWGKHRGEIADRQALAVAAVLGTTGGNNPPPARRRKKRVKVVGEHNTGTNWADKLVRDNVVMREHATLKGVCHPVKTVKSCSHSSSADKFFAVNKNWCETLGWKHGFPPTQAQLAKCPGTHGDAKLDHCGNTAFIILVKNPYAWLLSMFKHPYEMHGGLAEHGNFNDFVRKPVLAPQREYANVTEHKNIVHLWNLKYRAWISKFPKECATFLRYEDLLRDPSRAFKTALDALELKYTTPFKISTASTKGAKTKDLNSYSKYYLGKEWEAKYDAQPELLRWINSGSQLDLELTTMLGYEVYSGKRR